MKTIWTRFVSDDIKDDLILSECVNIQMVGSQPKEGPKSKYVSFKITGDWCHIKKIKKKSVIAIMSCLRHGASYNICFKFSRKMFNCMIKMLEEAEKSNGNVFVYTENYDNHFKGICRVCEIRMNDLEEGKITK